MNLLILHIQIEKTRTDLNQLSNFFDIISPTILAKSIELDILLNQYHSLKIKKSSHVQ